MRLKFRPLAAMGFTIFAVLFCCVYLHEYSAVISIATGAVLLIIVLSVKKLREQVLPVFLSAALLMSGLIYNIANSDVKKAQQFVGKNITISGTLVEKPKFENSRYYYILKTDSLDGKDIRIKLKLSLSDALYIDTFDHLELKANVYKVGASSNEVELYYKSKGIFLGAYAYNKDNFVTQIEKSDRITLSHKLMSVRETIANRVLEKLPNEYGGTVIGMLMGDKSFISDETISTFRQAGIAPLFAVSGLHLSVWVMGLYSVLNMFKVRKKLNSAIGIAFSLVFMGMTGLSPSVCRAGLMLILTLAGNLFNRKSDSVNSLGFATTALCIINPFIVADVGFLLSFSATFGIITICPLVDKYILSRFSDSAFFKIVKAIISVAFVSISATIGTLPVSVFFIKYISVYSILTNLSVTYMATICMIFGGLSVMLFKITFLSDAFGLLSGLLTKYIIFISEKIKDFPHSTISTADIYWKVAVIICLAVLIFTLLTFTGKRLYRVTSVLICITIVICSVSSYMHYDGLTQIRVLNVENGVAVIACKGNNKTVLCSGSDYYYTAGFIEDNLNEISREKCDLILLADDKSTQNGQILALIKDNSFNKIVMPDESQSVSMLNSDAETLITNNANINLWKNSAIKYFCCNEYSVAKCSFDEITFTIIFSSDKDADIDADLLDSDYLICSGFIPYSVSLSDYSKVIISADDKKSASISDYVIKNHCVCVSTAVYGDILIEIKNSKAKFTVKG